MKQDELILERACRELARRKGWVACKLEKNGNKGVPDDLFITPDEKCVLVEFKKDERQRLRPEQRIWRERFPNLVHVVCSFSAFENLMQAMELKK